MIQRENHIGEGRNMLIVGNGRLYTGPQKKQLIEDGGLVISGERIIDVEKTSELKKKYKEAEFLDAKGKLIMPGFINAHEHIYSAFARGLSIKGNDPKNFLEILEGTWWNIDRHLTIDEVYYSAVATYIESIKNGVTFLNDHHASFGDIRGSLNVIAKAAALLGVRTVLCYEVSDRDGIDKRNDAIEENAAFIAEHAIKKNNMLNGLFGLHASFTLSDETLDLVRSKNQTRVGYHVHIAEGLYDQEHCLSNYGVSVVERLYKEGILGPKTLAGHCIHISEKDMDILKETNTTVIHNPESNMANAVGAPDVIKLLDKGVRVGLGTDGYTHDVLESLKVANILQKHNRALPDRGFMEAITCFNNNAAIASDTINDLVGNLQKDYLADVILVDYKPNTPMTSDNFAGHLMFGISGSMTDTSIIGGKIVMQNRRLVGIDEDILLKECQDSANSLWRAINR